MIKSIAILCGLYRLIKNFKISNIIHFRKNISFSSFCIKCENEDEKIYIKKESFETLKMIGLIKDIKFKEKNYAKNLD